MWGFMSNFKKFVHSHSTQIPTVSGFAKAGRFSFNRPAVTKYGLADFKHCDLYFDEKTRQIGFVFLLEPSNGSVKVKNYNNNLSVAGSSMCAHFGIDLEKIKRVEITKSGEMLIIST